MARRVVRARVRCFRFRLRVRPVRPFGLLIYLLTGGKLSRLQKGFDEFAFAANDQAGKFLEPFALRHFRIGVQPLCEQDNLFVGNAALTHSRQKMSQQGFGQFLAADFRPEARRRKIRAQFLL